MDGSVTLVTCALEQASMGTGRNGACWKGEATQPIAEERTQSRVSSRHEQSSRKRNTRRAPTPSAFFPFTRRIIASSSSECRFRDFWLRPSTLTFSLKPFARSEAKYQHSEKRFFQFIFIPSTFMNAVKRRRSRRRRRRRTRKRRRKRFSLKIKKRGEGS